MDNRKKKWLAGALVIVVLVSGVGLLWSLKTDKSIGKVDYTIPGVPYFGMYNHVGQQNRVISGDTASAVISILEYWNPGKNNFVEAQRSIRNSQKFITGESVADFFNKSGYVAKEVHLEDNELKNYINSKSKTPLFAFLSVDGNQPEIDRYHPATVIIGFNESEQKVIVQDYWLGNNYEISLTDLDQRWSRMRKDEQKNYIVVQPQDMSKKLAELNVRKIDAYPKRTQVMDNASQMMKNYVLGYGSGRMSEIDPLAMSFYLRVENDQNFEKYLPPYFKSLTYYHLADLYLKEKKIEPALAYAQKSVDADHEINKPFNDWPGYDSESVSDTTGELSDPWIILGDVLLENKNYPKAKEAYEKALKIAPGKAGVKNKLNMIETALLQTK